MGLKLAGLKPKSGEGEGDGVGENGDWLETGEKDGVPERELPRETNIFAASHSSKSKRERSAAATRRGRESVRMLLTSLSREVSSHSNSALPSRPPRPSDMLSISFVLIDRCLEQYPLRCDSFMHPSREHSRLHCFPLNFLRIPFGVQTTSPFLYFCCAAVKGVRERDPGVLHLSKDTLLQLLRLPASGLSKGEGCSGKRLIIP